MLLGPTALIYGMRISVRRRIRALRALAGVLGNRAPDLSGVDDWNALLDVAVELRVEPALTRSLREAGLIAPTDVAEALRRTELLNATRNLLFRRQLVAATAALNQAGIEPLLFKGSLWLVGDGWDRPSGRWMVDLDLAVPAESWTEAGDALRAIGYVSHPGRPFEHPHELPFHLPRSPGPIELHVELGSAELSAVLPAGEAWAGSHPLAFGGVRARGLEPTHQVLHNLLHAAVQDLNHAVAGLPLRQLVVLAELVGRHGAGIDWASMARRLEAHGLGQTLRDHLWLAHRFAGMPLPRTLLPEPTARWHELEVLLGFGLGWPPHLNRNLRYAFGRAYLDSVYAHGDRPLRLAVARVRHAARLILRDGRGVVAAGLGRRD